MAAAPAPQRLHSGEAKVSMGALQTLLTSPTCAALREYVRFFWPTIVHGCMSTITAHFISDRNER